MISMVKSIIRKIWNETPDVKIFILELEKNIPFKAGQFVMLKIDKERFNKLIPSVIVKWLTFPRQPPNYQ